MGTLMKMTTVPLNNCMRSDPFLCKVIKVSSKIVNKIDDEIVRGVIKHQIYSLVSRFMITSC